MIRLFTGQIGAGKTAQIMTMLLFDAQYKGRPFYQHGIEPPEERKPNDIGYIAKQVFCKSRSCRVCPKILAELVNPDGSYPDDVLFADDWYKYAEPNAVFILDEVQHVWPQRVKGEPPESVSRLTESRHAGVDFLNASQDPMFMDKVARVLSNEHIHVQPGQLHKLNYVWPEYRADTTNKMGATKQRVEIKKVVFDLYKSAEMHTKFRRKWPLKLKLLILLPIFLFLVFIGATKATLPGSDRNVFGQRVQAENQPDLPSEPAAQAVSAVRTAAAADPRNPVIEFFDFTPLIPDYPESAPAYQLETISQAIEVPILKACVLRQGTTDCRCYTQQGTRYETSYARCLAFIEGKEFRRY